MLSKIGNKINYHKDSWEITPVGWGFESFWKGPSKWLHPVFSGVTRNRGQNDLLPPPHSVPMVPL